MKKNNKSNRIIFYFLLVIIGGSLLLAKSFAQNNDFETRPRASVYVLPFEGEVEPALYTFLARGFDQAVENKATYILVEMDTPGGRLDSALEIIDLFMNSKLPVALYVTGDAMSAGALISLAADQVYMNEASVIGAAEPVMGGGQDVGEGMKRKSLSYVLGHVRSISENMGHSEFKTNLAMAMVDSDIEIKDPNNPDEFIIQEGDLLSLTAEEATELDFINAVVNSREETLDILGLTNVDLVFVEETYAEQVARFLTSMAVSSLLLSLGFLGIFIELQSPGFGIPGILGIIALALFFWGHSIAGLAGMEGAILFLIGTILLFVELFILPGFGIPGILGILCIIGSIVITLLDRPITNPHFFETFEWSDLYIALFLTTLSLAVGTAGALAIPLMFPFMMNNRFGGWLLLNDRMEKEKGYSSSDDFKEYIGKKGITKTTLRPSGVVEIDGERMDVVSSGGFIEPQAAVEVIKVEGRRIVVRKAN